MNYEIGPGSARFNIGLPLAEIEMLCALSAIHYDGRCKAASAPGGFLYGWRNYAAFCAEKYGPETAHAVTASFSELDSCLKIMEMPTKEHAERAHALTRKFSRLCTVANEAYRAWTPVTGVV